jgi:hypothetical protein
MTSPTASTAAPTPDESWLLEGKWHLVSVVPWGREAFCTQLALVAEQHPTDETGILRFQPCASADFASYVLLQIADMGLAQNRLRQVIHFQAIERRPMKLGDVKRMLDL